MGNKSKVYIGLAVSFLAFFTLQNQFKAYGATSAVDEVTITVPASCSLSSTVSSTHSATIETGVYQDDIGETTINAVCNDSEGFSVYAVGYTDGEYGNNTMKPGVTSATNAIATGTATSGDTSNWAMKLSSLSENFSLENSFGSYHLVPSDYTKVASYPSNTTTTAGVQLKTTYATYISSSQVADTYNGKVKYVILHPSSNMPRTTIQDLTYMQDFKNLSSDEKISVAMSMQDRTVYTLIDNRDNRTYQIAKMKDGNIWMGENLDLGRTDLTVDLTSENSNLAETVTKETFNSWKSASSSYDGGRFGLLNGTDEGSGTPYGASYNYHAATGGAFDANYYSYTEGENPDHDICPAGWRMPSNSTITKLYEYYNSFELFHAPIADGGAAFAITSYDLGYVGSYGWYWTGTAYGSYNAYYFYLTTNSVNIGSSGGRQHISSVRCIAKKPDYSITVTYDEGISNVTVNGTEVANGTIINSEKDHQFTITVTTKPRYAFDKWLTTSGSVESPNDRWNASAGSVDSSKRKYTYYVSGKIDGTLSATSTYIETEMQNLNSSSCTTTPTDVYDNRDGHVYKIKRLQDGNCWMIDDLDLGRTALTTDLTSSNTNLNTTITASTFNGWKSTSSSSYGNYTNTGEWQIMEGGNYQNGSSFGTKYNYYTATAGTISGSTNYRDAEYDICPAGWRLPTGSDYGEFKQLNDSYDSVSILAKAPSDDGAAFHDSIYYWTSTREKAPNAYVSRFSYSSLSSVDFYPSSTTERKNYSSIRCVLKRPTSQLTVSYGTGISDISIKGNTVTDGSTITIEQGVNYRIEVTPSARYSLNSWDATSGTIADSTLPRTYYNIGSSSSATLSTSTTYAETEMQNSSASSCTTTASKVYDNRDGRVYNIQRLPDGKCWMVENLDLGHTALTTDLTSSNTNLSDTITASTFNGWKKTDYANTPQNASSGVFISLEDLDSVNHTPLSTLYNYYAASAGTISGYSNSNDASYDICPAGWRLPTGGDSGELMTLYNNYGSYNLMRAPLSENGPAFAISGYFTTYVRDLQYYGYYWSATKSSSSNMFTLCLRAYTSASSNLSRQSGSSIRCVMKNPKHTLTISYGSNVSGITVNGTLMADGSSLTFEEGLPIDIGMTTNAKYAIDSWSATSGTIRTPTAKYTTYTLGASDATLSVSASEVNTEMQNLSASSCTTTASKVYDNRDNHIYIIKRMLDGKCWMVENLDLGRTELTTDLTSSNTNINSTITASTFNGWKVNRGTSTYDKGEFIPITSSNATNGSAIDSVSKTEYGTIYNYYAASAGTIYGSSSSNSASYDICPAGWRLPTGGRYGEYKTLYGYYNTYNLARAPISENGLALTLAGIFSNSLNGQNENGYYWSSTRYNNTQAYTFQLSSSSVTSAEYSYYNRYLGLSVRCVLKT